MLKKIALLLFGLVFLAALVLATTFSLDDIRTQLSALPAAIAKALGGGSTQAMSTAALSANGFQEIQSGEFAVITETGVGTAGDTTQHIVATLPDGYRYETDINNNTTVNIIAPVPGSHLYIPTNNSNITIKNEFVDATGYDASGIAKIVNEKVKKSGSADVIVTMKLPSQNYYGAGDLASTRTTKKNQFQAAKTAIQTATGKGGKIRHELPITNGVAMKIDATALKGLANNPNVQRIDPDLRVEAFLDESVDTIKAPYAWALTDDNGNAVTGKDVRIAVIDTGVDYTNSDLGGCFGQGCKVEGGWDFVNNDADPMDDQGHGTHVAATAAGVGTVDATRLYGVAPGARILAYKVLNQHGLGTFSDVIAGINRAVDPNNDGNPADHADVISMSLGGICWDGYSSSCGPGDPVSAAIDAATAAGVVSAIAAGNSSFIGISTPGTAATAVTVAAACAPHGSLSPYCSSLPIAAFSSRGPVVYNGVDYKKPDIAAPGVMICATRWSAAFSDAPTCPDSQHVRISGTSMATPHIAGVLALLIQRHSGVTPAELKSLIKSKAIDLGSGATYNDEGAGLVDLQRLMISTLPVRSTPARWQIQTSPISKYSKHTRTFSLTRTNYTINTLVVAFNSPNPGITFTSDKQSIDLSTSTTSFSGTVQVDNDTVKAGSYVASITLTDTSGVAQGIIPVFINVTRTFTVSPTGTLDYGVDDPTLSSWSSSYIPITVTNLRKDISQNITVKLSPYPKGVSYIVSSNSMTLSPGAAKTVDTHFVVSGSSAKTIYTGKITFASGASTSGTEMSLATTFKKFYVVNITTGSSALAFFSGPMGTQLLFTNGTNPYTLYLDTPGAYSLYTEYIITQGSSNVFSEGIAVNRGVTDINVLPEMANHTIAALVPPVQDGDIHMVVTQTIGSDFGAIFLNGWPGASGYQHVSNMSNAYQFGVANTSIRPAGTGRNKEAYYVTNTFSAGISGDSIVQPSPDQYQTITHKVATDVPAGTSLNSGLLNQHFILSATGALRSGIGLIYSFTQTTPIQWITHSFVAGSGRNLIQINTSESCSAPSACTSSFYSPIWFTTSTSKNLTRSLDVFSGFSDFSSFNLPMLPASATSSVSIGLGPVVWNGKFINTSSSVNLKTQWGYAAFLRQDYALAPYDAVPYTLLNSYDGTVVSAGTLPVFGARSALQGGLFWLWGDSPYPQLLSASVAPGSYQLKLNFPYKNAGISLTSNVIASFNTSLNDPNPPFITLLSYSINGILTDQYYAKATNNRIQVRLDPNGGSMKSVAMSYSLDGSTFTNMKVTATSTIYTAFIPKVSSTTAPVISIRFVATDDSDNSLQYTFQLPVSMATPPGTTPLTASGTIDQSSLTSNSNTPILKGTAKGTDTVGLLLEANGGKVYGSGPIAVSGGKWSATVSPALAAGSYQATLAEYTTSNLLATGTLTIQPSQFEWSDGTQLLKVWSVRGGTLSTSTAPFTLTESTSTGTHLFLQSPFVKTFNTWRISLDVLPNGPSARSATVFLRDANTTSTTNMRTRCLLTGEGSVAGTGVGGGTGAKIVEASMTKLSDEWYHCALAGTFVTSPTRLSLVVNLTNGTSTRYQGDGVSGLNVRNIKIEYDTSALSAAGVSMQGQLAQILESVKALFSGITYEIGET